MSSISTDNFLNRTVQDLEREHPQYKHRTGKNVEGRCEMSDKDTIKATTIIFQQTITPAAIESHPSRTPQTGEGKATKRLDDKNYRRRFTELYEKRSTKKGRRWEYSQEKVMEILNREFSYKITYVYPCPYPCPLPSKSATTYFEANANPWLTFFLFSEKI